MRICLLYLVIKLSVFKLSRIPKKNKYYYLYYLNNLWYILNNKYKIYIKYLHINFYFYFYVEYLW